MSPLLCFISRGKQAVSEMSETSILKVTGFSNFDVEKRESTIDLLIIHRYE